MPPCTISEGQAYSGLWRGITSALIVLACVSLPLLLIVVPLCGDAPIGSATFSVLFGALVAVPVGLVLWIRSVSAVSVQVDGLTLALARPGLRFEVPCDAIEEIAPWKLPLPDSGLSFRMHSGRRVRYGVALANPLPVLEALAGVGGVEAAARVVDHPSIVYAGAKAAHRKGWIHLFAKFVVFSLAIAAIELNADWNIAEGAPESGDVLGPDSYVLALAYYSAGTLIYLVLYAAVWRALGEPASLAAAWVLTPAQAARVRYAVEIVCTVAYYAGAPLLFFIFRGT